MKILTIVTFAAILLGLRSSISIVSHYSANNLEIVSIPFIILFGLLLFVTVAYRSAASKISLFISALVTGIMSASAYSGFRSGSSHSSTAEVIFVFVPVYSVGLIPIIYALVRLVLVVIKFIKEIAK